jgi:hypothetical protein
VLRVLREVVVRLEGMADGERAAFWEARSRFLTYEIDEDDDDRLRRARSCPARSSRSTLTAS